MLPVTFVKHQLGVLLANDPLTLAPAALFNQIMLIKSPFVPNENLVTADLTPADFTGSGPKAVPVGPVPVGVDPATNEQVISIPPPAGGFRWQTTDTVNLPQTIYGFMLFNSDSNDLLATALLPAPVNLSIAGQEISIGVADLRIVLQPIS